MLSNPSLGLLLSVNLTKRQTDLHRSSRTWRLNISDGQFSLHAIQSNPIPPVTNEHDSYAETFDTDRDALEHAYAPNASFSYCIHDIIAAGSIAAAFTTSTDLRRFAPRKGSRNLCTYTSPLSFSPHAACELHQDILFYWGPPSLFAV